MTNDIKDPLKYIPKYFRVLTKPDARGMSDLVPMQLWPSQRYYAEHRTHRDFILKNRQTGMSSGIMALNAHALFTNFYERQTIITHDEPSSEFLFFTVQRFHHNLPEKMKPKTDWKSGTRMRFPKLDNYIYIDSARSDSLGISRTLTRAHLSEVAKWPPRKEEQLFADISQTVAAGGYMTLETTPKGRGGLAYKLYSAAQRGDINYKAFFFPWWWDITCIRESSDILKFTQEEDQLIRNYKLSPQQIAFRREKISELGDLFYQEYPESDIDCWLSSDVSVFDGIAIRDYLQQVYPGKIDGPLTVWKDVIGGEKYVIGVDGAGGLPKGDFSVASVLRVRTNEYVARLRVKMPPDLFAQEVMRLSRRYNDAELGVEREMHGHTILHILLEADCPNLYYHQDYDVITGAMDSQPGWKTSGKTKPLMIDAMASALRAHDIILWSENFLKEASELTWDGSKIKRPSGGYDDEVDALMIALQLREQLPIIEEKRHEAFSYINL